jgi:ABC-type protease/lipase transport system fused ATPase/permease subunit
MVPLRLDCATVRGAWSVSPVFNGVTNVLMLSGSLYMLQVYDRLIPSRNLATLLGLSPIVLFAWRVQGYSMPCGHECCAGWRRAFVAQ